MSPEREAEPCEHLDVLRWRSAISTALDLGLQAWRTTESRHRFTDALAALGQMATAFDAERARADRLAEALAAYRSALRSGEPETDRLRVVGDAALERALERQG